MYWAPSNKPPPLPTTSVSCFSTSSDDHGTCCHASYTVGVAFSRKCCYLQQRLLQMVQNEYLSWFKVAYFPVDKYVVKRFSYSSCCVKPPPHRHPLEMLFSPFLWSCIGRNLYEKKRIRLVFLQSIHICTQQRIVLAKFLTNWAWTNFTVFR